MVHCAQKAMLSWDQTWALRPRCLERRELFHSSCLRLCWSHDFRLAFRTPPSLLPQRWKGHWHHCSAPSALTQCWASRGEKKRDHGNDDVSEIIRRIDLCAAITGTIVDRNPLCQAYFTSCTTESLLSQLNQISWKFTPLVDDDCARQIEAHRMRINAYA